MTTKAAQARQMRENGSTIEDIAMMLDMTRSNVHAVLKRKPRGPYNKYKLNNEPVQKWRRKSGPPVGRCLKWIPEKGDYCGKPCKGQRCEAHRNSTLPICNSISTNFKRYA